MAMPDPDKCEMLDIGIDRQTGMPLERPTLKKFAEFEGVSDRTLREWKRRSDFQKTVMAHRHEWGKDRTSNVMAALYRTCIERGNAYDVELWLAYMENWDRKQVVKIVQDKFDADDLRAILAQLPEEVADEYYVKLGELITLAELHGSGKQVPQHQPQGTNGDQKEVRG